jgi:hypothetical protein
LKGLGQVAPDRGAVERDGRSMVQASKQNPSPMNLQG